METIGWKHFQKFTAEEIAAGPCLRVNYNGLLSFVLVVRPEQGMLDRVAGLCSQVDAGKGNPKLPERIFPPEDKIVSEALEALTVADTPQG